MVQIERVLNLKQVSLFPTWGAEEGLSSWYGLFEFSFQSQWMKHFLSFSLFFCITCYMSWPLLLSVCGAKCNHLLRQRQTRCCFLRNQKKHTHTYIHICMCVLLIYIIMMIFQWYFKFLLKQFSPIEHNCWIYLQQHSVLIRAWFEDFNFQ